MSSKLSKSSKSIHKKWQKEAEAKAGKGAKVIVVQSEAKKVIVNLVKDSFRPMNITSIYEALKATVPSSLLKFCLEAMSIASKNNDDHQENTDSGDDVFVKRPSFSQDKNKIKTSTNNTKDNFTGAIVQKIGRNSNTTLYYMNQQKLLNAGDGMDIEVRNGLISSLQQGKLQLQNSMKAIQTITANITLLSSQPFNKDIDRNLLPEEEINVRRLSDAIESARQFKVNEKVMKSIRSKIEKMSSHWRKRKKLCVDFLSMMEDSTEGIISMKKCLAGNGQIEVESDDVIFKQAKSIYSNMKNGNPNKRRRLLGGRSMQATSEIATSTKTIKALESFIAVKLGPNNKVERIIVQEDE